MAGTIGDGTATVCLSRVPTPRELTTSERDFLSQVVPRLRDDELLDGLVGTTEDEAQAATSSWASCVRVVGRDGEMIGYEWDWDVQRANLVVRGGIVLWAARF